MELNDTVEITITHAVNSPKSIGMTALAFKTPDDSPTYLIGSFQIAQELATDFPVGSVLSMKLERRPPK